MPDEVFRLLRRRLDAGEVTIEVVVLPPGGEEAPARAALSPGGELLAGSLPEEAASACRAAAATLGPGKRCATPRLGGGGSAFLERWAPAPRVVLFGGGHVGRAICAALRDLELRVLVVEDREYFADPARFEGRVETRRSPLAEGAAAVGLGPEDYALVVTRGHKEDLDCVRAALCRRPFYLGLLGSRRKLREFTRVLGEEGFGAEELAAIRCPVGLDIGAETPEEIAVAVAAELVAVRAGRLPPAP